ncbi:MAG TPA: dihydrodipicolinate synthase family protein [Acidimicrobiia bacterium]|nr:dihydrodipicolinate synthase family protein [Acidimicrobiia bacterium]
MPSRPPSTYVVSITPFTADGELDEDGLRRHLRRIGGAGVGVYLAGSGSGEGYTLDPAETTRVLELGVAELRGRVPVRAMGVEPRTAAELVRLARLAEAAGVDALQLYSLDPGHGNRPSSAELDRYYRTVLDATSIPVVLSTHESVGYLLPVDLVASLVRDTERVVGVNCSTGDMTYLVRLIEAVDGRADVHVGGPMHALTGLAMGGQGFLSSDANLAPRLCADVIEAWKAGDVRTLAASFRRLLRLYTATRELGGVTATKAALELLGLPGGPPRPPRLPASGETLAGVQRRILAELRPSDVDG